MRAVKDSSGDFPGREGVMVQRRIQEAPVGLALWEIKHSPVNRNQASLEG